MPRLLLALSVLLVACDGADDAPADDPGDDTDPGADTDRIAPLAPLPCHAWDPLDVDGGARTYELVAGDVVTDEVHTLGVGLPPAAPEGALGVRVVSDGPPASDVLTLASCGADGDGAYEVGFDGLVAGLDVRGRAGEPHPYLPAPDALDAGATPSWSQATVWALDARQDAPFCPNPIPLRRRTQVEAQVVGVERVDAGPLGAVDAVHVVLDQTERVDLRGDHGKCADTLSRVGAIGDATVTEARLHRWYVRGVGLVAAVVVEPGDAACDDLTGAVVPAGCAPASEKRLTACEGLPGCP